MNRFWEIDALRSLAALGMIVYHAAYDLSAMYDYPFAMMQGGWLVLQRIVAITFLLLVGISFAISHSRTPREKVWPKFVKRGLVVIGCGCLVSIATYIVDPVTYVRFGVLHLIGVSIVLLPMFARKKETCASHVFTTMTAIMIAVMIMAGMWAKTITVDTHLLLPLGFMPPDFATVDYFPLLPWFGIVLMGSVIGDIFYVKHVGWRTRVWSHPKGDVRCHPEQESKGACLYGRLSAMVTWPGRHALIIYLAHQPILIGMLLLTLGKPNV